MTWSQFDSTVHFEFVYACDDVNWVRELQFYCDFVRHVQSSHWGWVDVFTEVV